MGAILNLSFASLLLLCMLQVGGCYQLCTLEDIEIGQWPTGEHMEGRPEYEVSISNNCVCDQSAVMVQCEGFNSYEPVDTFIFSQFEEGNCVVNDRRPLHFKQTLKFNYTWDHEFLFQPIGSNIACP